MVFLFWFFSLLRKEVIVAVLAEVAIKALIGIIAGDFSAATLAFDHFFLGTIGA